MHRQTQSSHRNIFDRPHRATPRTLGAGPMPELTVRAIEVVQSIQNSNNSVTLIADKPTLVRVHVDPVSAPESVTVTAEIGWRTRGGETYLAVPESVRLDPSVATSLDEQRRDFSSSFNVSLPSEAVAAGTLQLRVTRLRLAGGSDFKIGGTASVNVSFVEAPPLRIRAVGLRYRVGGRTVSPEARHFSYLKSYLARAYPTARVEWSQIVVDANFPAPSQGGSSILANAQLAAMRSREISGGIDPRTHYVGLVDDDNGDNFMRGSASAIPGIPSPDTVCSSPVGRPGGFAGDDDDSYADWYGAHELGHTFGRFHPGFPVGSQDASDSAFPYADGLISTSADTHFGVDLGDPSLAILPRVLDWEEHHDVMTYAENQWVSAYTFEAILARLRLEEAMLP